MKKHVLNLFAAGMAVLLSAGCSDSDPEVQIPPPDRAPLNPLY